LATNVSAAITTVTVQAPSTNTATPVSLAPAGLLPAYTLNLAFLAGGTTPATDTEATPQIPADPALSYTAASTLSTSANEHDLSWVDDSDPQGRESATPRALLAQANESDITRAAPVVASQLVPDFQPLEDASPFLLATLKSVAVESTEPSTPSPVATLAASSVEPTQEEHAGSWQSPAMHDEDLPPTSGAAEVAPSSLIEANGETKTIESGFDDSYQLAVSWDWIGRAALPVAGFVGALGLWQAQRRPDRGGGGTDLRRQPSLIG
jgi:hypothetical protein